MSSAGEIIAAHRLKRRALSLGAVKTFDNAMQFLLPVILVRCLDAATFGEYRLLWLAVGTATIVTLNMGGALYFFLPRSEPGKKRLYIQSTIVYLAAAGLACGLALGPGHAWMPVALVPLQSYGVLVPAFVALWIAASLLDFLPTIEERIAWQAFATGTVAALRVLLVGIGAWASGSFEVIVLLLLAIVLLKLALLAGYVARWHGLGRPWFVWRTFSEQFRYAAPFGVANSLYSLRAKADQWVAASLFALSSFAAFSIAAVVGTVVYVFRHSVMEAFMPSMSRMEAAGDVHSVLEMNSRANVLVGRLVYPLLCFSFAFAPELIRVVYTASYLEAAPVMRVYIVGMAAMVVETGSLMLLLRQGAFALRVNAVVLVASLGVSWGAAHMFGLPGAAAGSVLATYLDRVVVLRRISHHTRIPLRRLQDWRTLAIEFACSAACAALAWALVQWLLSEAAPLLRLAFGALALALPYAALELRRGLK